MMCYNPLTRAETGKEGGFEMRYMTRADLKDAAQPVLRTYRKLPQAQEHPWYVDPALLAKEVLGLTIRYRHLTEDGGLLGLTSYGEMELELPDGETHGSCLLDGKTILIESNLLYDPYGPGRLHFTIGHECAHHILHRLHPFSYGDGPEMRRALPCRNHRLRARESERAWEEWQMDVLAAELLMPEELILQNLRLTGCPGGFDVLNPVWRRKEFDRFVDLCRLMHVSKQALAYRLKLLCLLRQNQMACPNAMIDIDMDEEEMVI